MSIRHAETDSVLATDVAVADSGLRQAIGLMGRWSVPDDYGLVFPFDRAAPRFIHMVLVGTALDVLWLVEGRVERVATLRPMIGFGRARADTLIELPAGAASAVEAGDRIEWSADR
ncbi:DUF192 domain-containing protein [Halococcoides cellulosivorans]|uniref:DUF192 domain-containing protein n=1 Tax=Halococcoides cellulosivorans TaxID=1679096 RepID=UPI001F185E5F|nr:DUF192 domain-containing protein [Halococcoides cellulosivorans]